LVVEVGVEVVRWFVKGVLTLVDLRLEVMAGLEVEVELVQGGVPVVVEI
jgi:hypothetical protein